MQLYSRSFPAPAQPKPRAIVYGPTIDRRPLGPQAPISVDVFQRRQTTPAQSPTSPMTPTSPKGPGSKGPETPTPKRTS